MSRVTQAEVIATCKSDLQSMATAINEHHAQVLRHARSALECAKAAGELLLQAKALLPHGQWLPWLEANCQVSPRQAQRYMRVSVNWDAITKNGAASYLTIDAAIASPREAPWETLSKLLDAGEQPDQVNEAIEFLTDLQAQHRKRQQALEQRLTNAHDDLPTIMQIAREAEGLQREAAICNLTLQRKIGGLLNEIAEFFGKLENEIGKQVAIKLVTDAWGWTTSDVRQLWAVVGVKQ